MRKIYTLLMLVFITIFLVACGGITDKEVAESLTKEGIQFKYGENMSKKYYDFIINEKARLNVYVEKNEEIVQEVKQGLEQNAKEKQIKLRFFEVNKTYLIVYYLPEKSDPELDNKVSKAISNLMN